MSLRGPADERALTTVDGDPGADAAARPGGGVARDSRLDRAGRDALVSAARDLDGAEVALLLADDAGCVLHRTSTSDGVTALLDTACLAPGTDLSETAAGPNAVAAALTSGDLVAVTDVERHPGLDCVAAPVEDPVEDRVTGAVALVAPAGSTTPAHVALVRQVALLVGQRMVSLDAETHQRVIARYLAASRTPGVPVFAVSEQSLHAGPEAMRLLAGLSHEDLWAPAYDALTSRPSAEMPLMLPSGDPLVVRLEPIEVDGRLVGALGLFPPAGDVPAQQVRVLAVPEYAAWSPAARRTAAALRRAAADHRAVCVVGEDGVGKATAVRVVASHTFPGRNLVQLEPHEATPERVAAELGSDAPVLVTDAHLVTTERLLALADAARDSGGRGWLALTYLGQPEALDERLRESGLAVLPATPLRARPQDVELVLPAMLRRYAAGRDLAMTPALVDRLRREPWPTNFHGLEAVVAEMARHARRRILDVDDLPEAFGAILRRRLTPMEWMTRSAIVAALQANGGNKELAAEELGMSRASIYRKIKAFGIDLDDILGG